MILKITMAAANVFSRKKRMFKRDLQKLSQRGSTRRLGSLIFINFQSLSLLVSPLSLLSLSLSCYYHFTIPVCLFRLAYLFFDELQSSCTLLERKRPQREDLNGRTRKHVGIRKMNAKFVELGHRKSSDVLKGSIS